MIAQFFLSDVTKERADNIPNYEVAVKVRRCIDNAEVGWNNVDVRIF